MKMVVHFADAPAHGMRYHDNTVTDDHPAGDPRGAQRTCDMLKLLHVIQKVRRPACSTIHLL